MTTPDAGPQYNISPDRVVHKLRDELADALVQKAGFAALVDQLLEENQKLLEQRSTETATPKTD